MQPATSTAPRTRSLRIALPLPTDRPERNPAACGWFGKPRHGGARRMQATLGPYRETHGLTRKSRRAPSGRGTGWHELWHHDPSARDGRAGVGWGVSEELTGSEIAARLAEVRQRIEGEAAKAGRPGGVRLLAVSKTKSPEAVRAAY